MIFLNRSTYYSVLLLLSVGTSLRSSTCGECEPVTTCCEVSKDQVRGQEKHSHDKQNPTSERVVRILGSHTQLLQEVLKILQDDAVRAPNDGPLMKAINELQRDVNRLLKLENQTQDIVQSIQKQIPTLQQTTNALLALAQNDALALATVQSQITSLALTTATIFNMVNELLDCGSCRRMGTEAPSEVATWLERFQEQQ
jgi:Mg2+ and Co2+ transporter CorA